MCFWVVFMLRTTSCVSCLVTQEVEERRPPWTTIKGVTTPSGVCDVPGHALEGFNNLWEHSTGGSPRIPSDTSSLTRTTHQTHIIHPKSYSNSACSAATFLSSSRGFHTRDHWGPQPRSLTKAKYGKPTQTQKLTIELKRIHVFKVGNCSCVTYKLDRIPFLPENLFRCTTLKIPQFGLTSYSRSCNNN